MRVLVIEFNGSGDMKGVFEKSKARVRMRAQKYQKNGETYMKFDTFNIKIQTGTQQVYLNNLFNGNKNLEEIGKLNLKLIYYEPILNINIFRQPVY